jgi:putative membrane protein
MALYSYRRLGLKATLSFALAAVGISLASELLGTSTGFPFGHYSYLNGLGYKVAGLVPFTIPLSWFYLGLASLLLARAGLKVGYGQLGGLRTLAAILLGSVLLTSWDFVLDPAMSQTALPFWYWHQPGAFFGMPYKNFAGWLGTGVVFMSVGVALWRVLAVSPQSAGESLTVPLIIYLGNFVFALVMSLAAGFYVPILMGLVTGVMPALICWRTSQFDSRQPSSPSAPSLPQALDASATSPGMAFK